MIDPTEKIRYVELVEYDASWADVFSEAKNTIHSILGNNCLEIHHIGSTAIPGMCAKPIIDMLPVVRDIGVVDSLNHQFEALGYVCQGEYGIPGRRFYWKSVNKRTHHIHLFEQGSPEILRHVAFKDFMIANPTYALAYALIKKNLATVFFDDIENYVDGKASFVQRVDYKTHTARAQQLAAHDDIEIHDYNPAWQKLAEAEINTIKEIANLPYVSIEHIGSTAVPHLSSKPIIDIFIVLSSLENAENWVTLLETMGYVFWDENPDKAHLRFFKGMPPYGMRRTHHIHIIETSNNTLENRIVFRDLLRRDEKTKNEYEKLKLALADSYSHDREEYTDRKTEFIKNALVASGYKKEILR